MNLDIQQITAVKTDSRRALVIAAAGSGKTRVLTERIAYLVEECKVSPTEILSFTFSRKAATEMKIRLVDRIGSQAYSVNMGTMHALALSMINRFGEVIGLKSKAVTVYSQWEEDFLLKDVCRDMGLHNGKAWKTPKRDIDRVFSEYYSTGNEPEENSIFAPLFHASIQRCRENNSLTYGGLLIGLRLLIPTLAKYLHIKHILVDEVQDTDRLQWAIILEMEKAFGATLFVVGDVDQCQPGDTLVLTSTGEQKTLKDLDPEVDKLVTFDRHGCHVYGIESPKNYNGYYSFRKSVRNFTGNLHTIKAGGLEVKCTPNHKWPVRFIKNEKNKKFYCIYVMQQGNRFRIGQCLFFGRRAAGFGFSVRCRMEKADRAWILSVHEDPREASIQEEVLSYQYGIPQVCFEEHSPGYNREIIEGIFSRIDLGAVRQRVENCLRGYGRNIEFPFWEKGLWTKSGWRTSHECYACNIIENICTVPKISGRSHEWVPVERNSWETVLDFPVYSLDVDKYHTYVVNGGLVTCNSIYEWRGAAPKYLVDHQSEFDIYRLESNYRSDPAIVTAANRLIEHNHDRITKTMVATRPESDNPVEVLREVDSAGLVSFFGPGQWSSTIEGGIAILARTHNLLQKIDRLMDEAKIPHTYVGRNSSLVSSEPFRRFHAFLKLCVNPYDNFSFLLIKDVIGLTPEQYGAIRVAAAEDGKSHFQVFMGDAEYLHYPFPAGELADVVSVVNDNYPGLSPESMVFITSWMKDKRDVSIASYLAWLATYEIQNDIKKDEDQAGITLMTIHAAKGLEFPVVIIAGCNEGIIPSKQALANGEEEAERRLMYVACTRARDQLVLAVRPEIEDRGKYSQEVPISRFIAEAGL